MNRRFLLVKAMTAGVVLVSSLVAATPASASQEVESGCSTAQWGSGECVTAIWKEGEDPVVEGVRQALSRGEGEQVRAFVEARATAMDDSSQQKVESLVQEASRSGSGRAGLVEPMSGGTDGNTYTFFHEIDELFYYGTCTSWGASCTTGGIMLFHLDYSIFDYPSVNLSGWISLNTGSASILLNDMRCETWYNNSPLLDIKVHDWSNCANAEVPAAYFSTTRNIFTENWNQGGTIGKLYHNYYNLAFTIQGTSNQLSRDFRTQEYKVLAGGGATYDF